MARLPSPTDLSGPASLRPAGGIAVVDSNPLYQGIADLGRGISQMGEGFAQRAETDRRQQAVADVSKAEAIWTKGALELGNTYDNRGDFANFEKEAGTQTEELKTKAAEAIRDPEAKARWLGELEPKRLTFLDSIGDRARALSKQADRVSLEGSIMDSSAMIVEPTVPEAVRQKARGDIQGAITVGVESGLITPDEGFNLVKKYLDGSEGDLARNRALIAIQVDPLGLKGRLGISGAMGSSDIASAAAVVGGGAVPLDPEFGASIAKAIGDRAYPDDPKLAPAYLKDPEINARYAKVGFDMLTKRYKGDMTAAVIASAPGGGQSLADQWVKSNHNEGVLPPAVRNYYRDVMEKFSPTADGTPQPVVAAPGVDLEHVDVAVLDRYEKMQTAFGQVVPIIAGKADDPNLADRTLEVDLSRLSNDERARFVTMASAMGFTGIGIKGDRATLDTGNRRVIGAAPAYAREVLGQHAAGDLIDQVPTVASVAPEYQALTFDQRAQLYGMAKQAAEAQMMDMRAGLSVVAENAPAAIAATGEYANGPLPTVNDFVAAYGAAAGIDAFKKFDASVETAHVGFGMRTMTNDQINAVVEAAVPSSTGDSAAIEARQFDIVSQAAAATLKARKDDPASYVMQTFPNVANAWQGVGTDPEKMNGAITLMQEAQSKLGIPAGEQALLPKATAAAAVATFQNPELPQGQRIGAIASLAFASRDENAKASIYRQLVSAGLPPNTTTAMHALDRGDTGAADYLFRASIVKAEDIKLNPDDYKPSEITAAITNAFDVGTVGNISLGVQNGTGSNFQRLTQDMGLMESAVKLRLLDGTARTIQQAVDMTVKDMYGDVEPLTGGGVEITVPKDDPQVNDLRQGFQTIKQKAAEALHAYLTPMLAGLPTSTGEAALLAFARDNYISDALQDGYFTNYGQNGQFVFIDPQNGSALPGPDGQPMVFTRDQVLAAGKGKAVAGYPVTPIANPGAAFPRRPAVNPRSGAAY